MISGFCGTWSLVGKRSTFKLFSQNTRRTDPRSPEEWSDYESVARRCLLGGFDGCAFVLTEEDPFAVIRIHDCVVDGEVDDFAQELVARVGGYAEMTPDGESVQIIVKADLDIPTVIRPLHGAGKKNGRPIFEAMVAATSRHSRKR